MKTKDDQERGTRGQIAKRMHAQNGNFIQESEVGLGRWGVRKAYGMEGRGDPQHTRDQPQMLSEPEWQFVLWYANTYHSDLS